MGWWRTFLDSLDSNGGHFFILLFLIVGGFSILRFDWAGMKAGEIIGAAVGALLMKMSKSGSNREQNGTTTTVARMENTTVPDVVT